MNDHWFRITFSHHDNRNKKKCLCFCSKRPHRFFKQLLLYLVTMITETNLFLPKTIISFENSLTYPATFVAYLSFSPTNNQMKIFTSIFPKDAQCPWWNHFVFASFINDQGIVSHEKLPSIITTRLVTLFWYQSRGQNELERSETIRTQKWKAKLFKNRVLFNFSFFIVVCIFV